MPSSRRKRLFLLTGGVVLVAIVAAGIVLALAGGEEELSVPSVFEEGTVEVKAGPLAPELSGTNPITDEPVSLADFRGKPVVINIWASWCPPCRAEAPDIRRFAEAHPEAVMLGIDFQDSVEGARAFYEEFGWAHPSIFDPDGALATKLGLIGLPTTIFLDAEQRQVARVVGEVNFEGLEQGLEAAKAAT